MLSKKYFKLILDQAKYNFVLYLILTFMNTLVNLIAIASLAPLVSLFLIDKYSSSSLNYFFQNLFNFFNIDYNFNTAILLFGGLFILSAITNTFLNYSILRLKYHLVYNLIINSLNKILDSDITLLFKKNFGEFNNTFTKEIEKIANSLNVIAQSMSGLFFTICTIILMISINTTITLIIIITLLSLYFLLSLFKKFISELGQINTSSGNKISSKLIEIISQFKNIKLFQLKGYMLNDLSQSYKTHQNSTIKYQTISLSIPYLTQIFVIISLFVTFIFFGKGISATDLSVIFLALQRTISPFSTILKARVSINIFNSAYEQLSKIISEATQKKERKDGFNISGINNSIKIENLSFGYDKRKILNNLNFKFIKGKINVIKGKSGLGKSTLIDLILGLIIPQTGKILIDENNLQDINLQKYRSLISYSPQDGNLFNLSIKDNILIGSGMADNNKLQEAIKFSALEGINLDFSDGLLTQVGEMGTEISGGQRQRILLARSIYRIFDSDILILDEPTSSLDFQNQKIIINTLQKIQKKVLLIVSTHDKRILEISENILDLENNK